MYAAATTWCVRSTDGDLTHRGCSRIQAKSMMKYAIVTDQKAEKPATISDCEHKVLCRKRKDFRMRVSPGDEPCDRPRLHSDHSVAAVTFPEWIANTHYAAYHQESNAGLISGMTSVPGAPPCPGAHVIPQRFSKCNHLWLKLGASNSSDVPFPYSRNQKLRLLTAAKATRLNTSCRKTARSAIRAESGRDVLEAPESFISSVDSRFSSVAVILGILSSVRILAYRGLCTRTR